VVRTNKKREGKNSDVGEVCVYGKLGSEGGRVGRCMRAVGWQMMDVIMVVGALVALRV